MAKGISKKTVAVVLERDHGLCVRSGCSRKVFTRSWCRRHWQEWRDSVAEPCRLDGCLTPARAEGLCNKHWQRNYLTGTFSATRRPTADERFEEKIDRSSGCWIWTGARFDTGYGAFNTGSVGGKSVVKSAHRYAYERIHGKQPSDLHLDHLCRNRACCNPAHLELVTPAENNRRGLAGPRPFCKRGHPLDNAYVRKDTGARICRKCDALRREERKHADKKAA